MIILEDLAISEALKITWGFRLLEYSSQLSPLHLTIFPVLPIFTPGNEMCLLCTFINIIKEGFGGGKTSPILLKCFLSSCFSLVFRKICELNSGKSNHRLKTLGFQLGAILLSRAHLTMSVAIFSWGTEGVTGIYWRPGMW